MVGEILQKTKAKRKKERKKERRYSGGQREIWKHLYSVQPMYFQNVMYKEKEVQTQRVQSVPLHNMVIRLLSTVTRISC
jgi:hypothetical protein